MTAIDELKYVLGYEIARLQEPGVDIHTIDELWERVGQDFDNGITTLNRDTHIGVRRLTELLAAQVLAEDATRKKRERRCQDAVFLIGPIVLLLLVLRAVGIVPGFSARVEQVVAGSRGLPAFHVITLGDVALKRLALERGSFTKPSEVVGRYALQPITAGSPLVSSQLSATPIDPASVSGLELVSLPIRTDGVSATTVPGAHVTLVFSPRSNSHRNLQPFALRNVLILAADRRTDQTLLVAATSRDDAERAASALGTFDAAITQSLP
ncbi:MAG TPA: SAF domain-containing protein [Candidatus Binatia bacterium]